MYKCVYVWMEDVFSTGSLKQIVTYYYLPLKSCQFNQTKLFIGKLFSSFLHSPHYTISFTESGFLQHHVNHHHCCTVRQVSSRYRSRYHCNCPQCLVTLIQLTVFYKLAHPSVPPRKLHTCPAYACSFDCLKSWNRIFVRVHIFKGNCWCLDCRVSTSPGEEASSLCMQEKNKQICSYRISNTKFPCSQECGKILMKFTSLRKHMLVKSHACNECGRASVDRGCSKNIGIYMQDSSHASVRCERKIPLRWVFSINICLCTHINNLPPALNMERIFIHWFVLNKTKSGASLLDSVAAFFWKTEVEDDMF